MQRFEATITMENAGDMATSSLTEEILRLSEQYPCKIQIVSTTSEPIYITEEFIDPDVVEGEIIDNEFEPLLLTHKE